MHAIHIDWLRQISIDAHIVSGALKAFSAKSGDCNHGYFAQCFDIAYSAGCGQAIQFRQIDIHQNQVGICLLCDFDCVFAVARGYDSVILLLEIDGIAAISRPLVEEDNRGT